MSKYYVRETLGDMTREVGYDTLAEVQAVLKELDSREYKRDEGSKRLTGTMIREAAKRYFDIHTTLNLPFNRASMTMDTGPESVGFHLFLSDLADMLNAELSK